MDATSLAGLLHSLIDRAQPEWKKSQAALRRRFVEETSLAIAQEHVRASNWSHEVHALQLDTLRADAASVELSFRSIPRRVGTHGRNLNELEVLHGSRHFTVLGDPGAGKTTTLRRLTDYIAHQPERLGEENFRCVIVVVCREEKWGKTTLYDILGRKTGISGRLADELDNPRMRLCGLLDLGALVVIDGLDEVPSQYREDLERDITDLGRYLGRAKLVVSCRSGDHKPLEGFDTAEIHPLTAAQIQQFVEQVLGPEESPAFQNAIQNAGPAARELANRPLFLSQMIQIFQRRRTIPDRPIYLYESLTRLIIQDWDEQRRVRRPSKYAGFGVDDKRRFLADLAYLLISLDLLRFGEGELAWGYTELAERYDLPREDARHVAQELEAHTGLLVQSGDCYEFSHRSLQEFLAAESIVRGTPDALANWWSRYPEVAAIATALAQDPNSWFAQLITGLPHDLDNVRPVNSFLRRLGHERPRFVRSPDLGDLVLQVLGLARVQDPDAVRGLRAVQGVRGSVIDALATFDAIRASGDEIHLARYVGGSPSPNQTMVISTRILETLLGPDEIDRFIEVPPRRRGLDPTSLS